MSLVLYVYVSYLVAFVRSVAAVSSGNCFDVFLVARVYQPLSSGGHWPQLLSVATAASKHCIRFLLFLYY